jgi:hypothetical protein
LGGPVQRGADEPREAAIALVDRRGEELTMAYACKLCIATKGLRGSDIGKLPQNKLELAEHIVKEHGLAVNCGTFSLVPSPGAAGIGIRHHACGLTSHHPDDVTNRFCGACHVFLDPP